MSSIEKETNRWLSETEIWRNIGHKKYNRRTKMMNTIFKASIKKRLMTEIQGGLEDVKKQNVQ